MEFRLQTGFNADSIRSKNFRMETTYKILAADGKEYGPVNLQQLQDWMREGRVAPETQLMRSDGGAWLPASSYPELSPSAASAATPPSPGAAPAMTTANPAGAVSADLLELDKRVRSAGSWYYWVAALSLINSVVSFSGGGGGFVIGLAVTQFLDAILAEAGGNAKVIGLVLGVLASGVFATFGVFACKRHSWAFIVGMVLYAFDTLLTVLAQHWLGLAFHVWVLVSLFIGLRASMQANAATKAG